MREKEGEEILKGKWIAICLWGLTVWSPVALVGAILCVMTVA